MANYSNSGLVMTKRMIEKIKSMITIENAIWIIATLLLLLFLGSYSYIFGPASHYRLSNEHTAWASFGAYLGGTIGPIISGMAFLYVWKAYQTQAKQLDEMRLNSVREEIQREIKDTINRIDTYLSNEIKVSDQYGTINTGMALELIFKFNVNKQLLTGLNLGPDSYIKGIEHLIDVKIVYFLFKEVEHLCFLLNKFVESGGSDSLIEAYKRRHFDSVLGLHYIGKHNIYLKVFHDVYITAITPHYSPL